MDTREGASGVEELQDAVLAVGLAVEAPPAGAGADLILVNPAGGRVPIQLKRVSLASADGLDRRLREWTADADGVGVLVADRVTEQARRILRAAGWGWLDLRGHLHLAAEGVFVDTEVPRLSALPGPSTALAGRVGAEVAAWMLLHPTDPAAVREIARTLARSASSVSKAIADMRAAGLVDEQRRPVVPDLFWQLAEGWEPVQADVERPPSQADPGTAEVLRMGLTAVEATMGWALTDTVAAAAYGAPLGVRSDYPLDFYVPDQNVFRRAVQLLGPAVSHERRAATIRLAPFPLVCNRRVHSPDHAWPLTSPLFVALDLARDLGRGREILEAWTPPPGAGSRVW